MTFRVKIHFMVSKKKFGLSIKVAVLFIDARADLSSIFTFRKWVSFPLNTSKCAQNAQGESLAFTVTVNYHEISFAECFSIQRAD